MKAAYPIEEKTTLHPSDAIALRERFRNFANRVACAVGSPSAFLISSGLLLAWGLSGPLFHYSDTWQLLINTATTIVTFLMVFLIQNTQNRDAKAIHLKLDELIRSVKGARNRLVCLENLSEEELKSLEEEFSRLRDGAAPASRRHREASERKLL